MTHAVNSQSRGTRRQPRVLTVNPPTLPTTRPQQPEGRIEKEAIKEKQIMGQARIEDLKLLHMLLHIEVLKTTLEEAIQS